MEEGRKVIEEYSRRLNLMEDSFHQLALRYNEIYQIASEQRTELIAYRYPQLK